MSLKEAIPSLATLSTGEKLALIEGLWDEVARDEASLPVTQAQQSLLDARYAEHQTNPAAGIIPWDEARARILRRL